MNDLANLYDLNERNLDRVVRNAYRRHGRVDPTEYMNDYEFKRHFRYLENLRGKL